MDELKFRFVYKGEKSLLDFMEMCPYIDKKWDGWVRIDYVEFWIQNKSFRTLLWMIIQTVGEKEVSIAIDLYRISKDFFC